MRKALITGITGQDGSYLAEFLLNKDYEVHGVIRRSSLVNTERIDHLESNPNLHRHYGDVCDAMSIAKLLYAVMPDEVYNLAAMSHVRLSYEMPAFTMDCTGTGVINLLEAIKSIKPDIRFYQASSSELFGNEPGPQNEDTPIAPVSPYGIAKAAGYFATQMYRKAYGIFATNGILFNHESPRRAETFLSRKVTKAVARIKAGLQDHVVLGNLNAFRDWGYAPDYVEAMWQMLQLENPNDYVIATNETHTVRSFVMAAFDHAGLDAQKHVKYDEKFLRAIEVEYLHGDYSKAQRDFGWSPKVKFNELVKVMVDAEVTKLSNSRSLHEV